jgi:hypothetical protein
MDEIRNGQPNKKRRSAPSHDCLKAGATRKALRGSTATSSCSHWKRQKVENFQFCRVVRRDGRPVPLMQFSIGQFREIFQVKNSKGLPFILIGGQAVNYWAENFLDEEPDLSKWKPFTSEDIDFNGNREDVRTMAAQLGLKPTYPHPVEMTALAGLIPFKIGDLKSNIEVVRSVPGVKAEVLERVALDADWRNYKIRVIDPISLLVCKTCLCLKISQKDRRDVDHLKIMLLCVRAYLRQALRKLESGELPVRGWLAAVERILKLVESKSGAQVSRKHGVNWFEALPLPEIEKSKAAELEQFRNKRLAQWKTKIARRDMEQTG